MFTSFAQTDYEYLQTTTAPSDDYMYGNSPMLDGLSAGALMTIIIVSVAATVFTIAGLWKMFQKAGRPGWAALVPIYNNWVFFELAGKPGWWGLLALGAAVPLLGIVVGIVALVLSIIATLELAKRFGKGTGFAILMILLPFIAFPMLGFGDAKYTAPADGGNGDDAKPSEPSKPEAQDETPAEQTKSSIERDTTVAGAPTLPSTDADSNVDADKKPAS